MYQRILVPTDGSPLSEKAAQAAVELAQRLGSQLLAFTVTEPYPYSPLGESPPLLPQEFYEGEQRLATERLKTVQALAESKGVTCGSASQEGMHTWRSIVEYAEGQGIDLIVMASHGRGGLSGLLLGSQTQKVLTHCRVPVLVVR
jgi:nucleotide-binding universal stress UspA family protein